MQLRAPATRFPNTFPIPTRKMFSAIPETTTIHYARKALAISTYLMCVFLVPLLLEEKYKQTFTYILPAVSLLSWGALSLTNYRPYAPCHVKARWDGALWIASATLYAALHLITASRASCMLFTVFGAPAVALTAAYLTVGRFYSERLAKEEMYPHLRERNAEADAARIAWLKQLGLNALYVALIVVVTFSFLLFLHEGLKATAGNNSREKYVALYAVLIAFAMHSAGMVRDMIVD